MFEWLRKLTADYTEEEYKAWLREEPEDIPTLVHIERDGVDEPIFSADYEFTKNLIKGGFYKFKDYDIALHEIAWETGYSYEELNEVFNSWDEDEPERPYLDRIVYLSDVCLEHDL